MLHTVYINVLTKWDLLCLTIENLRMFYFLNYPHPMVYHIMPQGDSISPKKFTVSNVIYWGREKQLLMISRLK